MLASVTSALPLVWWVDKTSTNHRWLTRLTPLTSLISHPLLMLSLLIHSSKIVSVCFIKDSQCPDDSIIIVFSLASKCKFSHGVLPWGFGAQGVNQLRSTIRLSNYMSFALVSIPALAKNIRKNLQKWLSIMVDIGQRTPLGCLYHIGLIPKTWWHT